MANELVSRKDLPNLGRTELNGLGLSAELVSTEKRTGKASDLGMDRDETIRGHKKVETKRRYMEDSKALADPENNWLSYLNERSQRRLLRAKKSLGLTGKQSSGSNEEGLVIPQASTHVGPGAGDYQDVPDSEAIWRRSDTIV